jgi:hypothetical protein
MNGASQVKYYSSTKVGNIIQTLMMLLLFMGTTTAQEVLEPPPAKRITKFGFDMLTGGIIILKAQLAPFPDTLNFVLDTGSGGISLDSATVAYFKLPVTPSDRTIRGIAGMKTVDFVLNRQLQLPGLVVDSLDFHINDYDLLSSVYGLKIDGIIGYSFLNRYIVKLDYDTHTMEVWTKGTIRYPKGGHLLRPSINSIPVQGATIKDNTAVAAKFYFDSGAGLCFLLNEDFVRDSNVLRKNKIIVHTQAEGLGGKKAMELTTLGEVKLGPYKFKKVPVYIFDDEFNVTAYPQLGGLIGNDLLRRFNTIVNYADREIHLLPNTHFNEPFDYSYSGLGIYQIDGSIQVIDVVEGSPGEKAGFKTGDVIIGVENNFSNNIQAYKTLLQSAGSRLKIVVMRNGAPVMLFLRVRNITKAK